MGDIMLKITKNSLVRENLFFFIATNFTNLLGFIFHFYMGRKLGPEGYGILGVILAIVYLFSITMNTIQTSIAKFTSKFKANNEKEKISFLLVSSEKKLIKYGLIFNFIFLLITPLLSSFLKIPILPLIVLSIMITFELLLPIIRGTLQGLQRFNSLGFNLIIEGLVKLSFGILLVETGFNIIGAVIAIVLSYVVPFFYGNYNLRHIKKEELKAFNTKELYKSTIPILITLISLTAFYSIDILLVKHFFTDKEAGFYSATSLIGKILFFGSLSISQVMFSKVSALHEIKKPHLHLLKRSLMIILFLTVPGLLIYYLFPEIITMILFGKEYLSITPLIIWSGIMITIFSLVYMVSFYNLSIHKKNFVYILLSFNILEIVLITLFHKSLLNIFIMISLLLFVLFLILIIKTFKENEKNKHSNSSI